MGLQDKISPALAPGLPEALAAAGIAFEIGPDGLHCDDADAAKLAAIVDGYGDAEALAHVVAARLAELAEERWRRETGTFLADGLPVSADDRGKILITAAADLARRGVQDVFLFKVDDGSFRQVDGATIQALYVAMAVHVQACFANEAALAAQITKATSIKEALAVDLSVGWPG